MTVLNSPLPATRVHVAASGAIVFMLFSLACGSTRRGEDVHILIDTSGSIPAELRIRILDSALVDFDDWIGQAEPGHRFTIWWLAPTGSAFPSAHRAWTMPHLKAPAHRSRKVVAAQLREQVQEAFQRLPDGVSTTPLLESLFYIGATQASSSSGSWRISVFSDLHQESARWSQLRPTRGTPPATVAKSMLDLCPQIDVPPSEIQVYAWPGLIGSQVNIEQFTRDRAAFTHFFELWSPRARHEFVELQ